MTDFRNDGSNLRKSALNTFCAGDGRIERKEGKDRQDILLAAHQKLRNIYNTHLQKVVEFVKTILVVDTMFLNALTNPKATDFSQPILRLHPIFLQNPAGSRVVLDERIRAARQLLSEHYIAVETAYRDALDALADKIRGSTIAVSPTSGGSTRRAASRKTRRNRHRRMRH